MAFGTFSGGGLGFGVTFTLDDAFSAVADRISNKFNTLENKTETVAEKINNSLGSITAAMGLIATGIGILAPLGLGIKLASELEVTTIAFETMLGSAEEAKRILGEIDELAVKTPFELSDVEKGYKRLLAFGVATKDIKEDFTSLGNITAGTGADLNSLIRAYGQVKGKGLLKGQEFMQFTEQGFDLGQALRDQGIDFDQTTQDVGEMKITFEQVRQAIRGAAGEGGRFDNLMEKLSSTTTGKLSNIQDLFSRTMRTVGKELETVVKPALDLVLGGLDSIEQFIRTKAGRIVLGIVVISTALVALGVIVVGLKMLFAALGGIIWAALAPLLPIVAIVGLLAAMFYAAWEAMASGNEKIRTFGVLLAIALGPLGLLMVGVKAIKLFNEYMEAFTSSEGMAMLMGRGDHAGGLVQTLIRIGGLLRGIGELFSTVSDDGFSLSEDLALALDRLGILDLVISIGTWMVRIRAFMSGMWQGMKAGWEAVKNVVSELWDTFAPLFGVTESWEDFIGRNTSDLETWKEVGKWAGLVILAGVLTLITAFAILGVVMLIALSLPLVVIGILIFTMYAVYELIVLWYEAWMWTFNYVVTRITEVIQWIGGIAQAFVELVVSAKDFGASMIDQFIAGISARWASLKSGLIGIANTVRGAFGLDPIEDPNSPGSTEPNGNGIGPVGSGGPSSVMPIGPSIQPEDNGLSDIGDTVAQGRATNLYAPQPTVIDKSTQTVKTVNLQVDLDGREIARSTQEINEIEENR